MKYFRIILSVLVIGVVASFYVSCNKDEGELEQIEKKLKSGTWILQTLKVDDVQRSDLFAGLKISFDEDGKYTSENGGTVFPDGGVWYTSSISEVTINTQTFEIIEIGNDQLTLKGIFTETILDAGRTKSVSGENVFTFSK